LPQSATDFVSTNLPILNLSPTELWSWKNRTRQYTSISETGRNRNHLKTITFTHVHTVYNYHRRHNEQAI